MNIAPGVKLNRVRVVYIIRYADVILNNQLCEFILDADEMNKISYILLAAVVGAGCSTPKQIEEGSSPREPAMPSASTYEATAPKPIGGKVRAFPAAIIYKTNGDYNDHVTINIDRRTGEIISYPGIDDVAADACPIILKGGWLLDRRGGVNPETTAFLRWTYAGYHAFKATPTLAELRAAIIPEARVTVVERLSMTTFDAQTDTAAVNALIEKNYLE